ISGRRRSFRAASTELPRSLLISRQLSSALEPYFAPHGRIDRLDGATIESAWTRPTRRRRSEPGGRTRNIGSLDAGLGKSEQRFAPPTRFVQNSIPRRYSLLPISPQFFRL